MLEVILRVSTAKSRVNIYLLYTPAHVPQINSGAREKLLTEMYTQVL